MNIVKKMEQSDYYLRELTANDWEKFHEMDKVIFPDDYFLEESFKSALGGLKTLFVVAVEKVSKKFIGYYKINIYGKEGHIQRVGVHPDFQRKGVGSHLLERSIYQLENVGCKNFFLYVRADNLAAINLYKKFGFKEEAKSWQFKIPFTELPAKPRGRCRHVEWGEIQLISLRFNLNPLRIQQYFGKENQYVVIYEIMGQQLGFARFNPNYPGASPFILREPEYFFDFMAILKEYVTKESDRLYVSFDNQEQLVDFLKKKKIPLNYELLKMRKEGTKS